MRKTLVMLVTLAAGCGSVPQPPLPETAPALPEAARDSFSTAEEMDREWERLAGIPPQARAETITEPLRLAYYSLEDYDVPAAEQLLVIGDSKLDDIVRYGFSNHFPFSNDSYRGGYLRLKDPDAFTKAVLEDAERIGYSKERIRGLSVKESVMLAAERFEYYGLDKLKQIKEKLRPLLESWSEREDIGEDARKMLEDYAWMEDTLRTFPGPLTAPLDRLSADEIYLSKEYVVCRHYALVAAGIFGIVLKPHNPGLQNTYVSCYKSDALPIHLWNQVITVTREGGEGEGGMVKERDVVLNIAFMDPTFYDTRQSTSLDALDPSHLGRLNGSLLVEGAKLKDILRRDIQMTFPATGEEILIGTGAENSGR